MDNAANREEMLKGGPSPSRFCVSNHVQRRVCSLAPTLGVSWVGREKPVYPLRPRVSTQLALTENGGNKRF